MRNEIFIIDNSNETIKVLNKIFENEKDYKFKSVSTKDIEKALKSIPDLIIIDEDNIEDNILELCKHIRQDEDNSITPVIVMASNTTKEHRLDILKTNVEFFIKKPIDNDYFYHTIKNIIRLMSTNRGVSPLTGLPGNIQIQAEIKRRVLNKEKFYVLYFDLDNFKAYNDVYGFLKGDEILKFTSRTIINNSNKCQSKFQDNFVGHIGGDDFVGITDSDEIENLCQNIIAEFDTEVLKYFNDYDIERGYIEIANRKGVIEQFPIVSLSIAVVEVEGEKIENLLEIGEVGAQVKHAAKSVMGSSYLFNRRI